MKTATVLLGLLLLLAVGLIIYMLSSQYRNGIVNQYESGLQSDAQAAFDAKQIEYERLREKYGADVVIN